MTAIRSASASVVRVGLVGALCLGGCLSKAHTPSAPRHSARLDPADSILQNALRKQLAGRLSEEAEVRMIAAGRRGDHSVWHLSFSSVGYNAQDNNLIEATYLESRTADDKALVVILPIWGASSYPGRAVMRRLRRDDFRGEFNILLIKGKNYLVDWVALEHAHSEAAVFRAVDRSVEASLNSIQDTRRLLSWALERPGVNPDRVAIVGFSFGAMLAAIIMGVDPRVDTGVFVMGGTDLHKIFAECSTRASGFRRAVLDHLGWTANELRDKLEEPLSPLNPKLYVDRIDPTAVLVVEASADDCIPEQARTDFWRSLGRPELISIGGGHRRSFLSMTPLDRHWTTRRISEFLRRRLVPALNAPALAGGD